MNLLQTPWLPVRLQDGTRTMIRPAHISAQNNPPVALDAPRADFNSALFQFLIGMLQTCLVPRDESEWEDRLEQPPMVDELDDAFCRYDLAFNVDGDGSRFMQDFEPFTRGEKEIATLLIETPGDNALRNNADHFIKRSHVTALCPICAVTALFTLQLNAPSGGVGHRTSLRGGGPLTTLVALDPEGSGLPDTLWHQLWLNVLPKTVKLTGNPKLNKPYHIFPWLAPTRTSDKKGGVETTPEDAHPYQMYWAMPRRVRLDFDQLSEGYCDLCGRRDRLLIRYFTLNYGINYTGAWRHPLSPYRERDNAEALPLHPQPGGITYRHWLGLVYAETNDKQRVTPAIVVREFQRKRLPEEQFRLWVSGYDMDNMKPRCWYEAVLPLYQVPAEIRQDFATRVEQLIMAAETVVGYLRRQVKEAWFKRPREVRGDVSFLTDAFFQRTEADFYATLPRLIAAIPNDRDREVLQEWLDVLVCAAIQQFDDLCTSGDIAFAAPARVARAHNNLRKQLHGPKLRKILTLPRQNKEEAT